MSETLIFKKLHRGCSCHLIVIFWYISTFFRQNKTFSCFYFTFSSFGVILWKWVLYYKNFCKIVSNTTFKLFGLAEEILSVRNISLLLYLVVLSMRNSYVRKLKIDILSMSNPKFMNVHEDKRVVNVICLVKVPNVLICKDESFVS